MDAKRELSSIDLSALVQELNRYEGAKVDKAYLYGDDLLRLRMRDFDRGRVELIVEVGDVKRAHVADPEHVPDAPGRPPNFAMMLRNRLSGADFAGVSQYEFDRILSFEFERDDEDTEIVAELFGQGNIAVLDETREVVQCLDTVRLKSRTVAPGSQYEFPSSRLNPLDISADAFERRMDDSDTDVVRTLATQLNLGGLYAEEVCSRAGVEKTLAIADATPEDYQKLYEVLARIDERLLSGDFDPRIYEEPTGGDGEGDGNDSESGEGGASADGTPGNVVDVTPFPLKEREGLPATAYDSFNEAVDDYFFRLDRSDDEEDAPEDAGSSRPDFEEQIAKQERIIEQQQGAIENFEKQAEAEREKAETLYANYEVADEIIRTIRQARENDVPWDDISATFQQGAEQGISAAEAVESVDGSDASVTVTLDGTTMTLDTTMGVEKNADRLYTEAKRVAEKKEGALAAIEDTREELEAAKKRRDEWEAADEDADEESEADDEQEEIDWLSRSSIPIRKTDDWYERFRWFHTSDGYLVIGGRNADQNEEIVKKYLNKHDRFFHTQAHGGPVTILKATGPSEPAKEVDFPDASLQEAAQFAVSYSSIWKEGRYADDAYMVTPDQVSKTPESGEYIEKGGFVIRGDRTYFRDVEAEIAVGVQCEPVTRVVGGPPSAIEGVAETMVRVEPGKFAQNDMATMLYRRLKERFADQSFVRKVASADRLQEFLPSGGSEVVEE